MAHSDAAANNRPFVRTVRDNEDDESDGAEDDLITYYGNYGPDCPIADPDVEHCGREPDDGY